MWNKKKWCETKRNDVKQKEMTRNKKKWRETKRNDVKQKEMTWSDSSWRFACGDVLIFFNRGIGGLEIYPIPLSGDAYIVRLPYTIWSGNLLNSYTATPFTSAHQRAVFNSKNVRKFGRGSQNILAPQTQLKIPWSIGAMEQWSKNFQNTYTISHSPLSFVWFSPY